MPPFRANVLTYTGGGKIVRALQALFKTTLTREEGKPLDEDVEKAFVHELFTAYKKQVDPFRCRLEDEHGEEQLPLEVDDDEDPKEVLRYAKLLGLGAAGAFQVPARGVPVACMWPVDGSWRCCG